MHIGDIYKHKKYNKFIQINGFATNMKSSNNSSFIIVFNVLQIIDEHLASCPSFMEWAYNKEQIEAEYDLYISADDINYLNFNEINEKIFKELENKE